MEAQKRQYVQMQQSEKPDLGTGFLSVGLGAAGALAVASDLSWRNALVLPVKKNVKQGNCHDAKEGKSHVLECIGRSLPLATNLDTDTDTFVDVFRTTLIVDAELESVAVFELECARVLVGG